MASLPQRHPRKRPEHVHGSPLAAADGGTHARSSSQPFEKTTPHLICTFFNKLPLIFPRTLPLRPVYLTNYLLCVIF